MQRMEREKTNTGRHLFQLCDATKAGADDNGRVTASKVGNGIGIISNRFSIQLKMSRMLKY